jgi:hypothetical protein
VTETNESGRVQSRCPVCQGLATLARSTHSTEGQWDHYEPCGCAAKSGRSPSRSMGAWEDVDHEEWCPSDEVNGECECLRRLVIDARSWARHGYEIGQRSCTWSDQGVAPDWLKSGLI